MSNNPLEGVSADVLAIMGHQEQREEIAGLPRWKQNQIRRDKKRIKIPLDFTPWPDLAEKLYELAEQERVGISSMIGWLVTLGLENWRDPKLEPSKSMKHDFDIVLSNGSAALWKH